MIIPYLIFIACAAVIIYCGMHLSKYGDVIAEKSGMGRAWFGLIMMAGVTSMPELISGISAVTYVNAPNLAIGDIVGSCMFNILILSMLDFFYKDGAISSRVQQSQILGAGLGVILLAIVAGSLVFSNYIPMVGWVSVSSIGFAIVYLLSIKVIYAYETKKATLQSDGPGHQDESLKKAILYYSLNAFFVIIAAIFLPDAGNKIAESTGLGQTFVGTLLIAASTSLPELVVSISALRIGAVDIAVGNLFGSNLFNIFILAIDDVFYKDGSLLKVASKSNLLTLFAAIVMTGIAIAGFVFQQEKKRWKLAMDTLAIAVVYVLSVIALYFSRNL